MAFFNFLMSKLESVGLSEIVLESFPDSDNFDYLFTTKHAQTRLQETESDLKDCR